MDFQNLVNSAVALVIVAGSICGEIAVAEPTRFQITSDAGTASEYTIYQDSYALVIGESNYVVDGSWPDLEVVPEEVDAVADALERQGFTVERAMNLRYAELVSKLTGFFSQQVSRDSRLLVYYAGHGWTDTQWQGFLVPVDGVDPSDPAFLSNLLSFDVVSALAKTARAKHVMMVFDSCFSGFALRSLSGLVPSEIYVRDIDRPGRQYITSGSRDQPVPDNPYFYQQFIAGMEGEANTYYDNLVTANELGY